VSSINFNAYIPLDESRGFTAKTDKNGRKYPMWHIESMKLPPKERTKIRSRTFPGIAKAMALQWAGKAI
jgi:hypothetical protein